ncbi:MAG: SagB/ThcOx family dehydrogenase [Clostridia bacterium]|nr:SagB/ThcOx family dehydrogenase [Clostridia bacterium]
MTEQEIARRIQAGRDFITKAFPEDADYLTDQELKRPQPPLAKAPMGGELYDLPTDFSSLPIDRDFLHVINSRKSCRVYTGEPIALTALSYLLWCAQGVKAVRGQRYATLRTVACGGARHEFECYLALQGVTGLPDGLYHYLPMTHQIERLPDAADRAAFITRSLCGQSWGAKANAVFYFSCVFYRAEWRYGVYAHPVVLIDSGHITQNLYLAAASIGLGGCAVAAVEPACANAAFGLDGREESIFYAMPVGAVRPEDHAAEDAFYAFVKQEGL